MTSWPLCARYHALVVPMTPAPRTTTLMPTSDKKQKGGKLALYPPSPCPKADSSAAIRPLRRRRHSTLLLWNESTLLTFARQASYSAALGRQGLPIFPCKESLFAAAHPSP